MSVKPGLVLLLISLIAAAAAGQGVRDHTRLARPAGTTVTKSQAEALTLTVSTVSNRLIQTWVRLAGVIDRSGRILTGSLSGSDAALVKVGQRVRAFPPSSRSSMYQARVTRAASRGNDVDVEVSLASTSHTDAGLYVMEVVVERGPFLAIPNEAIIEEGDRQIVYVEQQPGQYVAHELHTGIQGELLTQVLDGVKEGDQVVTFGSFFIDAEQKLKGTGPGALSPPTQ
jgi:Cu(I)/Ag(I) efflux system membrane fusion protein